MEWARDETTICGFRHLLEKHELGGAILDAVNHHLDSRGIRVATGTIVDAAILHAPPSRKNAKRKPKIKRLRRASLALFRRHY